MRIKKGNKRGVSVVVGYVLLITFGIVLSAVVYGYLKTYVPSETVHCPDGVSVLLKDYSYNCSSGGLVLDIKNNGKFNVNGYYIRASYTPNTSLATNDLSRNFNTSGSTDGTNISGIVYFHNNFAESLKFGEEVFHVFNSDNSVYFLELIPIRFQTEDNIQKLAICSDAKITQEITCTSGVLIPGAYCGDGACGAGEDSVNCPSDCGTVSSGLVIELSFENNVQDSSGNNHHGTLTGATYTTGVSGQAISFDGLGDYVSVPYVGNLPQGSVAFWLKSSGSTGNTQLFFEGDGTSQYSSPGFEGDSANFYFFLNEDVYVIPTTYTQGMWTHFAGTWDGSTCKLYKNGALVSSLSCLAGENGITNFYIGGRGSSYTTYGLMDELKVYNRALSLSEVQSLYGVLQPVCGNGVCEPPSETATSCASDCASGLTIGLFEIYEAQFNQIGSYSNPYTSVTADVHFTSPSGKQLILPLFWDGNNVWKFRFTPNELGTWGYVIQSNDAGLNGESGALTGVYSGKSGFLVRDSTNLFNFKRSNGEHAFMMGDTCWNCFSDVNSVLDYSTFEEYVDIRADQNFNFIRSYAIALYSGEDYWTPTWPAHSNEGGRAFEPWDPDKINPDYFKQMDERVEYANSKGIAMNLLIGSDETNIYDFFSGDYNKMERYIRYLVARYSAYNINWEGRTEFEEQSSNMAEAIAFANFIGNTIENNDPYNHLQSMHTLESNRELGDEAWLDWIMHQSNDESNGWSLTSEDREYNKPVLNEEFYYENSGNGSTHPHHVDANTVRKGAWQVIMHGAGGLAFGNTGIINARSQPFAGVQYATTPGANYMNYLYNFFQDKEYWKLSPNHMLCSTATCLVNPNNEYVVYSESGTTFDVQMGSGTYIARFYNPRTGAYSSPVNVAGCGLREFTKPTSEDWVLHIKLSSSGTSCTLPQETIVISDNLRGSTNGVRVGGTLTSKGYKPGIGENHIFYDVPSQVENGYVEFEVKGFDFGEFSSVDSNNPSYESAFVVMYDGRGIPEPIQYFFDYRNNYFRWEMIYRSDKYGDISSGNRFKSKILVAADTPERLNSDYAVFPIVEENTGDWQIEPNGLRAFWDPDRWYTLRVEWDNNYKNFRVYREGILIWDSSLDTGEPITDNGVYPVISPYPWFPIDFKIHLGSGPDRYSNKMPDITYRNFKLVKITL